MSTLEQLIYPAMDRLGDSAPTVAALPRNPGTALLSAGSTLDSLDVVSLVVAVEEQIELETRRVVVLASERAMSRRTSPFRDLQSLADYVDELLGERS
ncbi:MAG: hypothetical protein AAFX94_15975 [Myxococcota bacterium]